MGEREKLRRALLGLLLAIAASLAIWGIAIALFIAVDRAWPGAASHVAPWRQLVRYGLGIALTTVLLLGAIYEIRRIVRSRRRTAEDDKTAGTQAGNSRSSDQPGERDGACEAATSAKATAGGAADDVVRLP
jgi:dolichyl-phosphate-mannose--protein O-mannosyl transferase